MSCHNCCPRYAFSTFLSVQQLHDLQLYPPLLQSLCASAWNANARKMTSSGVSLRYVRVWIVFIFTVSVHTTHCEPSSLFTATSVPVPLVSRQRVEWVIEIKQDKYILEQKGFGLNSGTLYAQKGIDRRSRRVLCELPAVNYIGRNHSFDHEGLTYQ